MVLDDKNQFRSKLLISGPASFYNIFIDDVAVFYLESGILYAITSDLKKHTLDFTLEKLLEELNPEYFFRANRSTIINIKFIDQFETYFSGKLIVRLFAKYDKKVVISRKRASQFKKWMGK
jgi:DNA-binding LytR/AlgR family response regulator